MVRYDMQYRIPWIVFDCDEVSNFDSIIKKAEESDINVGWSNPCFEIWMYAYLGSMPTGLNSKSCCSNFSNLYKTKVGKEYSKSDTNIYISISLNTEMKRKLLKLLVKDTNSLKNSMKMSHLKWFLYINL